MLSQTKKFLFCFLLIVFSLYSINSKANTQIKFFSSENQITTIPIEKLTKIIQQYVNINNYRNIKVQLIYGQQNRPHHLLVYLFSKEFHSFEIYRIDIDASYNPLRLIKNYRLSLEDNNQQPGIKSSEAKCPDENIEFIAFAPNEDEFEVNITKEVAESAISHGLKTVQLLVKDATRENYLNYMSCPKLKGNFYDGDASSEDIVTYDGVITYRDIKRSLRGKFRFKVTNIWLACEAFNDPLKTAVISTAQAQKYAAGINNLRVGPSDRAAACAMKAALDGKPMHASFDACYHEFDIEEDEWGFDGFGNDIFGT